MSLRCFIVCHVVYVQQWELGKKSVCTETAKKAYSITLPNKAQAVIPAVISLTVQQTPLQGKDHKCFHTRNPPLATEGGNHASGTKYHSCHLGVLENYTVTYMMITRICK